MRTSLDLPDPLFKSVKMRAIQQGVTFKELVARYLEAGLRDIDGARSGDRPAPRAPLPVAIHRQEGAPLHPALTNAELDALLVAEDQANDARVSNSEPGQT